MAMWQSRDLAIPIRFDPAFSGGYNQLRSLSGSNSVVECDLAKVEVAGSNPVSRSKSARKFSRYPSPWRGFMLSEVF